MSKKVKTTSFAKMKLAQKYPDKIKLGSQETDKGVLQFPDADDLAQGVEVFVVDDEGNFIIPEDGDYAYDDKIAVIENGIVVEIKTGTTTEQQEETPEALEEKVDVVVDVVKDLVDIVESMGENVTSVSEELKKVKEENLKLTAIIKKAKLASARDFEDGANPKNPKGDTESKVPPVSERLKKVNEFMKRSGLK